MAKFSVILVSILFLGKLRRHKLFKINILYILLATVGLLCVINGIRFHVVGYVAAGLGFAIIYPLISIFLEKESRYRLYKDFATAGHYSFICLLIISFFIAPGLVNQQYASILLNANGLGQELNAMSICEMYLAYISNGKKRSFHLIFFSISLILTIFTGSRTAMIGIALAMIGSLVYFVLTKTEKKVLLKNTAIVIIATAIALPSCFFVFGKLNPILNDAFKAIVRGNSTLYKIAKIHDYIPESEYGGSLSNVLDKTFWRIDKGINDNSSIDSGRKLIWEKFISEISLTGHASATIELGEGPERRHYDAHNSIIQMAYSYGIIAGVFYTIFIISYSILIIVFLYRSIESKLKNEEILLAALCLAVFIVQSMLSANALPETTESALIFWLSTSSIVTGRYQREE